MFLRALAGKEKVSLSETIPALNTVYNFGRCIMARAGRIRQRKCYIVQYGEGKRYSDLAILVH